MRELKFPKDFRWGTATASYQIEGASAEDGKGPSMWDSFSHRWGKIQDRSNGDTACDHYHLYKDDLALMKKLGYKNYRFSVSWPRVLPQGQGDVNKKGLDFYDRLVDEMLKNRIEPFLTLYHWDLPDALEKAGGWYSRDTANRFADFTEVVVKKLKDRVKFWITLNEPMVSFLNGYYFGEHAPGRRDFLWAFRAPHNLLLAHGYAVERIRAAGKNLQAGITNQLMMFYPEADKDKAAADRAMDFMRLFMDPIYKGFYPRSLKGLMNFMGKEMQPRDMDIISQPIDFLGLNSYSRIMVRKSWNPITGFKMVRPHYPEIRFTDMGWEVYPQGMYDVIKWVKKEYNNPVIYITENGAAYQDTPARGRVKDADRTEYLKSYIAMVHKAMEEGARVKGYFVWSFMDNFEWAKGFTKRFGLVYNDYDTQKRTVKDSGLWYSNVCGKNKIAL